MAESNAPEHKDRGLFGLFGKKDGEKQDQQQSHTADPYATHAPAYNGGGQHAPPSAVSHQPQSYGQSEGGYKQHDPPSYGQAEGGYKQHEPKRYEEGEGGKLNRSNSSSSSSSDEEESGEKKKEGRKKKGSKESIPGRGEGRGREEGEKKGMMEKIKEKLPGRKEGDREI